MDRKRPFSTVIDSLELADYQNIIALAKQEDLSQGDPTSEIIVPVKSQGSAIVRAQEKGVLCGKQIVDRIVDLEKNLQVQFFFHDGQIFEENDILCRLVGSLRTILRIERILLNFLQYLSGISWNTAQLVQSTGKNVQILDTRKTVPSYRKLAKYAVFCGGGRNHRLHLGAMIMIKDNHLQFLDSQDTSARSLPDIISKFRQKFPALPISIEVDNIEQLARILQLDIDIVLLDNMTINLIDQSIQLIQSNRRAKKSFAVEFSGSFNQKKIQLLKPIIQKYSDINFYVSLGSLTHTTRFLDLSLELSIQ